MSDIADLEEIGRDRFMHRQLNKGMATMLLRGARARVAHAETIYGRQSSALARRNVPVTLPRLKFMESSDG